MQGKAAGLQGTGERFLMKYWRRLEMRPEHVSPSSSAPPAANNVLALDGDLTEWVPVSGSNAVSMYVWLCMVINIYLRAGLSVHVGFICGPEWVASLDFHSGWTTREQKPWFYSNTEKVHGKKEWAADPERRSQADTLHTSKLQYFDMMVSWFANSSGKRPVAGISLLIWPRCNCRLWQQICKSHSYQTRMIFVQLIIHYE